MATIKVKIDDEWIEVPSIGISPMAEAPIDGKTYGRKDGDWTEISTGGTQYLDLSMFTGDTGTLSEEDYQKVVKAYEDKIIIGLYEQVYAPITILAEEEGSYIIYMNVMIPSISIVQYVFSLTSDKSYNYQSIMIGLAHTGSGTKALTDSGQYAEFAKPIKLENGGSGSVTKQISPNTFYSFGECSSLTITFGSETSGIVNVYSFEFTSGTNPTTLNLPPEVKFPSGETFAAEANKIYEISIRNNKATYQVWDA